MTDTTPRTDTSLNMTQVAAAFGVTEQTVRRRIRQGRIPSYRVGKSPRIAPEVVAAILADPARLRAVRGER